MSEETKTGIEALLAPLRDGWTPEDDGDRFAESDERARSLYDAACSGEDAAKALMSIVGENPRDGFLLDLATRMPLDRLDRITALCGDEFLAEMQRRSEEIDGAEPLSGVGQVGILGIDLSDPQAQRDVMERSLAEIRKRRPEIGALGVSDANEIVFYLDGGGEERTPLAASVNPYEALAVVAGICGRRDEEGEGGDAGVADGAGPDQEPPAGDQGA